MLNVGRGRERLSQIGLGSIALSSMLSPVAKAALKAANPLAPKQPHFKPKAKRVIYLFMGGAPSQIDLFDNKPALQRYNGCVRGTNTPNCYTYSGKVMKYADQAASAMLNVPIPTGIAPAE